MSDTKEYVSGWIGVDLDGTLAHYDGWVSATHIGKPVPLMLARVKAWRRAGQEVRIFTARIHPIDACVRKDDMLTFQPLTPQDRSGVAALRAIQQWSRDYVGEVLPITNVKDYGMIQLWDDRCVQVEPNTGRLVTAGVKEIE